jgi:probable rRNA maturation factor
VSVRFEVDAEESWATDAWFERVVEAALAAAHRGGDWAIDVGVCDDETIRDLNREYRDTDAVTDVLSFSLIEGEAFPAIEGVPRPLGEVIVSLPTARRQAAEHDREVPYEFGHLLIHGVLHLLGFDHADPAGEATMRAKEAVALAKVFGHADGRGWEAH